MSYKFDPENPFKAGQNQSLKTADPVESKGLEIEPFFSTPESTVYFANPVC